jgi:predicted GNAT family acetyltransferase
VHRVRTKEQATLVTRNARLKLIAPEHLSAASPPVRLYYAEDTGKVIAWGRSVMRHPSIAYVAGMSTNAAYCRRGIASAILSQMLADDAAQGASHSVLLSSRMGYALYRKIGYEQIGSLQMFARK